MVGEHPRPGLYRARLVKGGVDVGVAIFVPCPFAPDTLEPTERSRFLSALVNGVWWFKPGDIWVSCLKGGEITPKQYQFLIDDRAWAAKFAPLSPEGDPWKAIVVDKPAAPSPKPEVNINEIDPIF